MAVWLIRAGSHGEFEDKFIQDGKVYATWDELDVNIATLANKDELIKILSKLHPENKPKAIANWASQLWPFAHEIAKSDWVVLPLKTQRAIQIGEITGGYHFEQHGTDACSHWLPVKWIGDAVPRENFGKDLLNTFGALMTICRVKRNNAEKRLAAMRDNG